jgi:hypothetical protein
MPRIAPPVQTGTESAAAAIDLLLHWLRRRLKAEASQWLEAEIGRQRDTLDERRFGIALGLAGRRIGRDDLSLAAADLASAQALRRHWRPDMWRADEAARATLILATWTGDEEAFAARVDALCLTGELSEHVACLKGFVVFPAPARLLRRAREATRSSMQPPFEAIACHNPYPADYFDDAAFNQMVVKCVFCGVPIETVVGLDERRNGELVRMMRDLVSERHAAGRPLPDAVHRWIADADATPR